MQNFGCHFVLEVAFIKSVSQNTVKFLTNAQFLLKTSFNILRMKITEGSFMKFRFPTQIRHSIKKSCKLIEKQML